LFEGARREVEKTGIGMRRPVASLKVVLVVDREAVQYGGREIKSKKKIKKKKRTINKTT
jgi:hypothetical protein